MALDTLTDREVEGQFWQTSGAKDDAVRQELGMTPVPYYKRLNQLVDGEATLAHDPVTVNRLRRIRSSKSPVALSTDI